MLIIRMTRLANKLKLYDLSGIYYLNFEKGTEFRITEFDKTSRKFLFDKGM